MHQAAKSAAQGVRCYDCAREVLLRIHFANNVFDIPLHKWHPMLSLERPALVENSLDGLHQWCILVHISCCQISHLTEFDGRHREDVLATVLAQKSHVQLIFRLLFSVTVPNYLLAAYSPSNNGSCQAIAFLPLFEHVLTLESVQALLEILCDVLCSWSKDQHYRSWHVGKAVLEHQSSQMLAMHCLDVSEGSAWVKNLADHEVKILLHIVIHIEESVLHFSPGIIRQDGFSITPSSGAPTLSVALAPKSVLQLRATIMWVSHLYRPASEMPPSVSSTRLVVQNT